MRGMPDYVGFGATEYGNSGNGNAGDGFDALRGGVGGEGEREKGGAERDGSSHNKDGVEEDGQDNKDDDEANAADPLFDEAFLAAEAAEVRSTKRNRLSNMDGRFGLLRLIALLFGHCD